MIKRPLVWILAVWILGEIIATHLGYSLTPKTDIDVLVSEHGQIRTEAEGKVVDLKENDYGLSLVLDDVFVQVPDSVRFSSEDYIVPGRYEMKLASDTKATSYMEMTDCAKQTGHVESTGHVKLTDYMKPMNYMKPIDSTKQTGYMGQTGYIKLTSDTRATGYVKLGCRISVLCNDNVIQIEDSQIGYTNNDALQIDVLHIGNHILVRGKLTEIEEATNPGQFDLRSWYGSKGIGFSMKAEDVSLVDGKRDIVRETIRLIRKRLSENLERVSSGDDLGIFRAVLLGDKSDLSEEESDIFRRGGIAHILAVSGMHVSILGAGLFWLLRKAPVQAWIPPMCAAGFMLAFVVLTGASPSAIRAATMFAAMMAARLTGKSYDPLSSAALAALIMLYMYPGLLQQAGFQLSFASAFSIHVFAAGADRWVKPEDWISKALLTSVCVSMGIMPLLAWHYFQVPVTGVFVNIVASLLTSLLLVSACAAALIPFVSDVGGVFFAGTGHYVRIILEAVCRLNDRLPGSTLTTGRPPLWLVVALEAFVLCLSLWMMHKSRKELFEKHMGAGQKPPIKESSKPSQSKPSQDNGGRTSMSVLAGLFADVVADTGNNRESSRLIAKQASISQLLQQRKTIAMKELARLTIKQASVSQLLQLRKTTAMKEPFSQIARQSPGNQGLQSHKPTAKEERSGIRLLFIAAAYCLMLLALTPLAPRGLDIACLDIGQGDCTVVRADGEVWIIDAGSSSIEGSWSSRIKPYLLYEGIDRVDVVALSHPDDDHVNAAYDMLMDESIAVGSLLLPEASYGNPAWDALKAAAKGRRSKVAVAASGEEYRFGKGMFRCLYPEASEYGEDVNALSMVLELCYGDFTALFMGDLGEEGEPEVLARLQDMERGITFLKVGHHGSKYSTGEPFVKTVRPVFASISCGRNNRYGHPSEEVLARLESVGTNTRVTAWSGAVLLDLKGDAVTFRSYLEDS